MKTALHDFISKAIQAGGYTNDDLVAVVLPLLEEINGFHQQSLVAPLEDLQTIHLTEDRLDIDESHAHPPVDQLDKVMAIHPADNLAVKITSETSSTFTAGDSQQEHKDRLLLRTDQPPREIGFLRGYRSYEILLGHHDALTDIFILGLIMASLSYALDLEDEEDLSMFIQHRQNPAMLQEKLHPVIANVIQGMTEPDRRARLQDLGGIIDRLKHYRYFRADEQADLGVAYQKEQQMDRSTFLHSRLRSRLFDISRRNRLLYYKPNLKFLNLTVSSVPSVLNYRHIDPNTLFTWNDDVSTTLKKGNDIKLSKYLRFEDNDYITPTLDKIRLEANKDIQEYGFSQLKLVLVFLHWYNTKEAPQEKITSPLLLLPVTLARKKGLQDQYTLEPGGTEAEVNPVLAFQLRELYDIRLPATLDLSAQSPLVLFESLNAQMAQSASGITLSLEDKPRIKIIHAQARQTLTQFRRRRKDQTRAHHYHHTEYSYQREHFQPLGLQLFNQYIKPQDNNLELIIGNEPVSRKSMFAAEASQVLYQLDEGAENPFRWEFDLCNMVLGNFNYRKMSLVRDYDEIMDKKIGSSLFDTLFSEKPFTPSNEQGREAGMHDFSVVPSDPTQQRSVLYARTGGSYIIQGPPGTGKSQTITNLVADQVARGKKVLFVCEKRAALDVVYHRLKQQGLDRLCCLIHDSQADKKGFIMDLKETASAFNAASTNARELSERRMVLLRELDSEVHHLREFHQLMEAHVEGTQIKLRSLIEQMSSTVNTKREEPGAAGYSEWERFGDVIVEISNTVAQATGQPFLSEHPLRHAADRFWEEERSAAEWREYLQQMSALASELEERIEQLDLPATAIRDLADLISSIERVFPFALTNRMPLLDKHSPARFEFQKTLNELKDLHDALEKLKEQNAHWKQKLSQGDARNAIAILEKHEGSFFAFLYSAYRRTKKAVAEAYDFSRHQIRPTMRQVVQELNKEYETADQLMNLSRQKEAEFGLGPLPALLDKLNTLDKEVNENIKSHAARISSDSNATSEFRKAHDLLNRLRTQLAATLRAPGHQTLQDLSSLLAAMADQARDIPALQPLLKKLSGVHATVSKWLTEEKATPNDIRERLGHSSIAQVFLARRDAASLNALRLRQHVEQINNLQQELLSVNAQYILASQRERFQELIRESELSTAGKDQASRDKKKRLTEGRKILDNEFGKSMRFKSIRELAGNEAAPLIRELKPVWLMSPLSVSDTLPLQSDAFDVIIYDEASQITLEEGVPPLYRAAQAIVVGDEMQMPPANFFSSNGADPDDLWEDETDEGVMVALDADSFLTQGARKLPSVMLGWHYRSRHECLIAFSNASFYDRSLLTVPDALDLHQQREPLSISSPEQAAQCAKEVITRPISYHHLTNGIYEGRSNLAEAEYIAHLVRQLLTDHAKFSIGVVAFSMEQQGEIEGAVERLAEKDSAFAKLLDDARQRQEDGQFTGIFFKNLENVQGDERDIIIMSTCYGYDPKGRMLMNFGPINRRGGEKRLNVIFSRAKHHMCVVSSIKFTDIRNEYNEGPNFFRKYLQYAELASKGDMDAADRVLASVKPSNFENKERILISKVSEALRSRGYFVRSNVGQSGFKCPVAVKRKESDEKYLAGILLDGHDDAEPMEAYVQRPELMQRSGWKVVHLLAKDWYLDQTLELERMIAEIESEIPQTKTVNRPVTPRPAHVKAVEQRDVVRLENREDGSEKFWQVEMEGAQLIITYGKIGSAGQRMVKAFASRDEALAEKAKLVQGKLGKGYRKI